jgi:hypothetical protein
MTKTIEDIREQMLRVLSQISSDDPDHIARLVKDFDDKHGIEAPKAARKEQPVKTA